MVVHEESSFLSKRFIQKALDEGCAVVLDGVGNGSPEKMKNKTSSYREKGYKIFGYYVNIDTDLSIKLNQERYKRTGRYVPDKYVHAMNRAIPKYFETYVKNENFDEVYLYDTNLRGQPRLIVEYKEKNLFRIFTSYDK